MGVFHNLISILIVSIATPQCNGDYQCGILPGGMETLANGTSNVIPWGAFITTTTKDGKSGELYPGILISPSLIFMSTHYFYNDKLRQLQILRKNASYTAVVGSSEFSSSTLQGQHIPVSFVSIHPNFSRVSYWTDTRSDFALAHLSRPVEPSLSVQPVCIPSFSNQQTLAEIKETKFLFLFGWPSKQATTCNGIRLQVSSHEKCLQVFAEVVKQSYRDDLYCAAVSETNGNNVCPNRDFGSFYQLNGSYYLGGPVINLSGNNGNCTKGIDFLIWSVTNETLEWIRNSERCGSDYFTCFVDGKCIPISKLCDGKLDCEDSSDEHAQYCRNPVACTKDEFQCQLYGSCIPKFKMDDGFSDCLGGDDETNSINHYLIAGLCGSVIVIGLAISGLAYFYCKVQRLNKHIRDLTDVEVEEFFQGSPVYNTVNNYLEVLENRESQCYFPLYINESVVAQPWNEGFEISAKDLEMREELGRGEFGVVYKAILRSREPNSILKSTRVVAVKTQYPNMGVEQFKNLLREVKITAHVGSHDCVESFIGAWTQSIRKLKVYLVVEFCEHGNMLSFMHKLSKDYFKERFSSPVLFAVGKNLETGLEIFYSDLYKWASQIACGMAHLGRKSVIHGDLAARNILLNENLDAKIADFGLSRELVQDNIYVKKTDQPIPWKWMALESFRTHEFSYKTDVWAYGVTLWEIFSLGASPYGNIPCNAAFVLGLNNGNRLPSPEFASSQLYEILLSTWNSNPESRPTFEYLELVFRKLMETVDFKV